MTEGAIMPGLDKSDIEKVCKDIISVFEGVLTWKLDDRFDAVLAEFSVDSKDGVRDVLERHLSIVWDASNIGKAPGVVQMVTNDLSGLMSGQMIFTSDPARDYFLFCAWWPWGDGESISIRIGPSCNKISDKEKAEIFKLFKVWFGI
jgi:hypothetical protein